MNTNTETPRQERRLPAPQPSHRTTQDKPWLMIGVMLGFLVVTFFLGRNESEPKAEQTTVAEAPSEQPESAKDAVSKKPGAQEVAPGVRRDEIPAHTAVQKPGPTEPEATPEANLEPEVSVAQNDTNEPAAEGPVIDTGFDAIMDMLASNPDEAGPTYERDAKLVREANKRAMEAMGRLYEE